MNNNESRRNRIEKRAMLRRQSAGSSGVTSGPSPSPPVGMPSAFYLPSSTATPVTSGMSIQTATAVGTPSSAASTPITTLSGSATLTVPSSSSALSSPSPSLSLSSSASSAFLSLPPTPSSYLVPNHSPSPSPVPMASSSSSSSMPSPFPSFMSVPSPFSPSSSAPLLAASAQFASAQFPSNAMMPSSSMSSSASSQAMIMAPQVTHMGLHSSTSTPMMTSSIMTANSTATASSEPMMSPSISSPTSSPPPSSPTSSLSSMPSPPSIPPEMSSSNAVAMPASSDSSGLAMSNMSASPMSSSLQMMMKAFPQMAYMMGMPTMSMAGMPAMPAMPAGMAASAMPAMGAMAAMPAMPMSAMAGMPAMGAMPLWMPTSMGMPMMPMPMTYPGMPASMGMPMMGMPMPLPYPTMAMSMPPMSIMTPYGPMAMPMGQPMPTTTTTTTTSNSPRSANTASLKGPQSSADSSRSAVMGSTMMQPAMMGMPMPNMGPATAGFPSMAQPSMAPVGALPVGTPDTSTEEEMQQSADDGNKRKRPTRPYVKPVRTVRPKFTHQKGVQCQGMNNKKRIRCRNAALMEYIGEQPLYCAEHIEQDPSSLYCKCSAPYLNEPGDKKRCKEIVLKEFGYCYKHYGIAIQSMNGKEGYLLACSRADKLASILNQLCQEASSAKKSDGDMYQRKNKLINKLQQMYTTLNTHVTSLGSQLMKEAERGLESARNMNANAVPQLIEQHHPNMMPLVVSTMPMGDPSLPEHDASLAASALVALPHCDVAPGAMMHASQTYVSAPTALLDLSTRSGGGSGLGGGTIAEANESDDEEERAGDIPKHKEIEREDEEENGPTRPNGASQPQPLIMLDPATAVLHHQ